MNRIDMQEWQLILKLENILFPTRINIVNPTATFSFNFSKIPKFELPDML
ncbi:MAG: hypothetical protein ACJAZX_001337 [Rickettsiales bacterium]|jgi:hypothetical protein